MRDWLIKALGDVVTDTAWDTALVTLPLTLVVAGPDRNLNTLPSVHEAGHASTEFWGKLGIRLAVRVVGLQTPLLPTGIFLLSLQQAHFWDVRPTGLAVYVWPAASRVGIDSQALGEAFGTEGFGSLAVVAGDVLQPGGGSMLDEIVDHEVGHLLGLDHAEGTFMSVVLELHNRVVTPAQRKWLRAAVRKL